ncbi:hypothetical protein QBC45DRAFT_404824 [Copromyces sp. CBS 386.78]|nr:hypothetical protein QBC45DRAFT_404824 [Copromyces sp. CBS 386.78]
MLHETSPTLTRLILLICLSNRLLTRPRTHIRPILQEDIHTWVRKRHKQPYLEGRHRDFMHTLPSSLSPYFIVVMSLCHHDYRVINVPASRTGLCKPTGGQTRYSTHLRTCSNRVPIYIGAFLEVTSAPYELSDS